MLVQTWKIIEMAFKDEKCGMMCLQTLKIVRPH